MTTPKACFARFWKLLRASEANIWRQHRAAAHGPERQREALELLASVVWHLELAHSLAPWPTQKMEEFYSKLLCRQPDALTPWKIWVDHYNEAKVTRSAARILIDYSLHERADVGVYAVQNTLIADAAMPLDSIREVLLPISNENSLVLMGRSHLERRLQNRTAERIVKDTAIIVAFRDSYLHAEVATPKARWKNPPPLAEFRRKLSRRYSLFDVGMACIRVWMELYEVCMSSSRQIGAQRASGVQHPMGRGRRPAGRLGGRRRLAKPSGLS
jgi:hypothetical protein